MTLSISDQIALANAIATFVVALAALLYTIINGGSTNKEAKRKEGAALREAQRQKAAALRLRFQSDERLIVGRMIIDKKWWKLPIPLPAFVGHLLQNQHLKPTFEVTDNLVTEYFSNRLFLNANELLVGDLSKYLVRVCLDHLCETLRGVKRSLADSQLLLEDVRFLDTWGLELKPYLDSLHDAELDLLVTDIVSDISSAIQDASSRKQENREYLFSEQVKMNEAPPSQSIRLPSPDPDPRV